MKTSTPKFLIGMLSVLHHITNVPNLKKDHNSELRIELMSKIETHLDNKNVELVGMDFSISNLCDSVFLFTEFVNWNINYFTDFPNLDFRATPIFVVLINKTTSRLLSPLDIATYPDNVYVLDINEGKYYNDDLTCTIRNCTMKGLTDLTFSGSMESLSTWLSKFVITTTERFSKIKKIQTISKPKPESVKMEQPTPSVGLPGFSISVNLGENQIQEIVNRVANIHNQTATQTQNVIIPQLKTMSTNFMEKVEDLSSIPQRLSRLESTVTQLVQNQTEISNSLGRLMKALQSRADIDLILTAIKESSEVLDKKIGTIKVLNFLSTNNKNDEKSDSVVEDSIIIPQEAEPNTSSEADTSMVTSPEFDLETYLLTVDEKISSTAIEINFDVFLNSPLDEDEKSFMLDNMKEFEKIFLKDLNDHINHKDVQTTILNIYPDAEKGFVHFRRGLNTRKIIRYGALLSIRPLSGGNTRSSNYNTYIKSEWFAMFTTYLEMCGLRWKK